MRRQALTFGAALIVALASALPAGAGPFPGNVEKTEDRSSVQAAFPEDPVVLVHGCYVTPDEDLEVAWDELRQHLVDAGYPHDWIFGIDNPDDRDELGLPARVGAGPEGPRCVSRHLFAQQIGEFVDAVLAHTGAERVDIAAHSAAPPAVRLYLQKGGTEEVRDFVALAGADHGVVPLTTSHAFERISQHDEGIRELSPAYACDPLARNNVQTQLNGCLTPTGRLAFVDETPGGIEDGGQVDYLSIMTVGDELIQPWQSSCLNQQHINDCSDPVNVVVDIGPSVPPVPSVSSDLNALALELGRTLTHARILREPRVLAMVVDHFTDDAGGFTDEVGGRPLSAALSGDQEVPGPGDPEGTGSATITLNQGRSEVCWEIAASDITLPATAAHVHKGSAGMAGPVVVTLSPPDSSGFAIGCAGGIDDALIKDIRQDPAAYHVNVHTRDFQDGAIRGQLSR